MDKFERGLKIEAKVTYPFGALGADEKGNGEDDDIRDVLKGEICTVLDYGDGVYTLVNDSLGTDYAWFRVPEGDMEKLFS